MHRPVIHREALVHTPEVYRKLEGNGVLATAKLDPAFRTKSEGPTVEPSLQNEATAHDALRDYSSLLQAFTCTVCSLIRKGPKILRF